MAAPIGVFAYDRPSHLALTLERLERCHGFGAHPVTLFLDAASKPAARDGVLAVRHVAEEFAARTGARIVARQTNLKFGNITKGIDQLCAESGEAIVVEDDIVVSPDFLTFMQAGLDAYREVPEVWMVSGTYIPGMERLPKETFFLPVTFIWGWATWARAWRHYVPDVHEHARLLEGRRERARFDLNCHAGFVRLLRQTLAGHDTWDIQWYASLFQGRGLALHCRRGLVWNSGTRGGTHYKGQAAGPDLEPNLPWVHGNQGIEAFSVDRAPRVVDTTIPVQADPEAMRLLRRHFRRMWAQKRIHFLRRRLGLG